VPCVCDTVCSRVLQWAVDGCRVCCCTLQHTGCSVLIVVVCCGVLRVVCCGVLQRIAVYFRMLQYAAVCCVVLQCAGVAVC